MTTLLTAPERLAAVAKDRLTGAPLFHLTQKALLKALELQRDFPRYRDLPLRLYVEGKGCDGFTYGVSFDKSSSDDSSFSCDGLTCIIDPQSLVFCKDSTIDWVDDERGAGFLVENPHQRNFRGKFYKRKVWMDRLAQGSGEGTE